ncbi:MAG: hypothetical protein ACFFCS_17215 [Candidatus Hodarchaeota archaeon]
MLKPIEDFWIIQDNGVVLFKHVLDEKIDAQLFGGFMSAIDTFASKMDEQGLHSFQLGDKKFTIVKNQNIVLIGTHKPKVPEKKVLKSLTTISMAFLSQFKTVLDKPLKCNITRFENFTCSANATSVQAISQLKSSLW